MSAKSIVLVGGPDSGKSNYLARLWAALAGNECELFAPSPPEKIGYVEGLLEHLLQGRFAPRSGSGLEDGAHDLTITVSHRHSQGQSATLVVPDVLGELWKNVVLSSEIPQRWHDRLQQAGAALLFVRAHSKQNHSPLDWVTAQNLLAAGLGEELEAGAIPTQVALCELLRTLESTLSRQAGRPRVAVVVAAWDMLDPEARTRSPYEYLERQFPMFAGRLKDEMALDVQVFGLSILGGDVGDPEFRSNYLKKGIQEAGYVVVDKDAALDKTMDVTLPIQWLLRS